MKVLKQASVEEDAKIHSSGLLRINNLSHKVELIGCPLCNLCRPAKR